MNNIILWSIIGVIAFFAIIGIGGLFRCWCRRSRGCAK